MNHLTQLPHISARSPLPADDGNDPATATRRRGGVSPVPLVWRCFAPVDKCTADRPHTLRGCRHITKAAT